MHSYTGFIWVECKLGPGNFGPGKLSHWKIGPKQIGPRQIGPQQIGPLYPSPRITLSVCNLLYPHLMRTHSVSLTPSLCVSTCVRFLGCQKILDFWVKFLFFRKKTDFLEKNIKFLGRKKLNLGFSENLRISPQDYPDFIKLD